MSTLICTVLFLGRIIDGDTIVTRQNETIRMAGYDTPETHRPKCEAEMIHGEKATLKLSQLIVDAKRLEYCPVGVDRWFRTIAVVKVDGVDVGEILINAGLAQPWPIETPWCELLEEER